MRWIRELGLFLALAWLALVALTTARAQEPTPESTPPPCAGIETAGGSTVLIGAVQVSLPEAGSFRRTLAVPGAFEQGASICHVGTGATITISGVACTEISRDTAGADGEEILDAILASCQLAPTPAPEPTPLFACPDGEAITGGTTVTIGGNLQVSLLPGNYVLNVNDQGVAQICNVDEEFSVYLLVSDCTAPAIAPPNDPHQEEIAQIKASCITLAPTPDPAAVILIQPPNTGDAGLITED